ncbi:AraC family transcriptional regulator [Pedobacter borealis]|uniref:AraC family transcriptional regulator n=1 Tax=Pedobacter borealis TaxID=475254 RepID=UPI000492F7F4|nr:AraC family transcriptional regulator [Pedobacter borealis]
MKSLRKNFKKDGFEGQRAIVIPRTILQKFCIGNKLINKCFITDIGYYPKASLHFRERTHGAEQNILIYCVDGKGTIKINKAFHEISSGDFIFIPRGQAHSYKTDPENPWTIYWCHFKGEQADEIIELAARKYGSPKSYVSFSDDRINLFDSLYQTLESGYGFDNLSYVNLRFPQFLSSFLFVDKFEQSPKTASEDLIELSFRYMQDNLDRILTLEMIAENVNISASHFSAIFKKRTGFPPIEYLNHLKIQKACQFLQFTDLRIKEIAFKIGLEDQYYFSRLFNKVMGISPTQYREQRGASK